MAKAAPFSMRLSDTTDRLVNEEAKRTRRTKGAVVKALAEEALRTRRFPGIAFRGSDWNRRPWGDRYRARRLGDCGCLTLVWHAERDGCRDRPD